jgi:hypothetical protein
LEPFDFGEGEGTDIFDPLVKFAPDFGEFMNFAFPVSSFSPGAEHALDLIIHSRPFLLQLGQGH